MKIAVTGSLDGKLNDVYDELLKKEKEKKFKIDLVLVAGNFQGLYRNLYQNNDFKITKYSNDLISTQIFQ